MLKKFTSLLLLIIYLSSVVGIEVSAHYCGGKLRAISYFTKASEDKCCGDNHKKDCCKDEHKVFKLKENHKTTDVKSITIKKVIEIPQDIFYTYSVPVATWFFNQKLNTKYHSPPDLSEQRLYQQYCTYLI